MASWVEARTGINRIYWRQGEVYLAQITPAASPQTKLEGLVVATRIKGTFADPLEGVYLDLPFSSGGTRCNSQNLGGLKRPLNEPQSNLYTTIMAAIRYANHLALAKNVESQFDKLLDLVGANGGGMLKLRQRLCWSQETDGSILYLLHLKLGGPGWEGVRFTVDGTPQEVERCIESLHANVRALHVEPQAFQPWKAKYLRGGQAA